MKQKKLILSTMLLSFGLLASCSGKPSAPSTSGELTGTPAPEVTISLSPSPEATVSPTPSPDPLISALSALSSDLETLSAVPRPVGSEGEEAAVQYLQKRFQEMGYEVTLQPYTSSDGKTGSNVIAVKQASAPEADILVISAHHDSVPTAYGANDNATGVSALLAVADALKNLTSDTELRFISFTDEENGKNGSRLYVNTLSEEERLRIIGDIQLDMLAGLGSDFTMLYTTDGAANWLTDLLQQKAPSLNLTAETASDHTSFQLAGIPSVLLSQNARGYLYHSAGDIASQIDLPTLEAVVRTVVHAVTEISSEATASYRQLAREQGDGYTYSHTRQTVIYFGSSLETSEAYIGAKGTLTEHREETWGNSTGAYETQGSFTDIYDTYRYSMRWFGEEAPMNTYYHYRNNFLQNISVHPTETGYTAEQMQELLYRIYGAPESVREDADGSKKENWTDVVYSKYLTLSTSDTECTLTVSNYSLGISNILASYEVKNGTAEIPSELHSSILDYAYSVLPKRAWEKITQFQLFTDGTSNILAYTSPRKREDYSVDNTQFSISIDYYDAYDENGAKRDWSKLTGTVIHEYGHVLLEDETQVDLSVGTSTHDPAGFIEGSFRKRFYDRFWKDISGSGVRDYEENPTNYVSRYGANQFHEDIADTFTIFVLGECPAGNTVAEEKILFFWDDPDMVSIRNEIRENIGLEH
ncbi:MAG: M28 family peptidase [Lachnospiraceae bacterium]